MKEPVDGTTDRYWMEKALALARRGEGFTRPNPPVGAVVVRSGCMIGRGYHRRAGGPHAEVYALRQAAAGKARGSTLYVTLEPCATWGRTGPCTEAILQSGIRRVVVAARDPNPRNRGRGLHMLKARGIQVVEGVCREAGERLIAPFAKWITTGLPYVTLKMGMTLDGKIADAGGRSRWITSPASRDRVRQMRRTVDAVLVGGRTVRLDDPSLLCETNSKLRRIIVDSTIALPLRAKVLNDGHADRTIIATTAWVADARRRRYSAKGSEVWALRSEEGRVSLKSLLSRLGREGFLHILCEGGSELAWEMVRRNFVDRFVFFVAPKIMGGWKSIPVIGGEGWSLGKARGLAVSAVERVGDDILIEALPERR